MRTFWITAVIITGAALSYIFMLLLTSSIPSGRGGGFWLLLPFTDKYYRENLICTVALPFSEFFFILASVVSLIWALHLYAGLREKDASSSNRENVVISRGQRTRSVRYDHKLHTTQQKPPQAPSARREKIQRRNKTLKIFRCRFTSLPRHTRNGLNFGLQSR